MRFSQFATKAGVVMGVNWAVGFKLLGAGAMLNANEPPAELQAALAGRSTVCPFVRLQQIRSL